MRLGHVTVARERSLGEHREEETEPAPKRLTDKEKARAAVLRRGVRAGAAHRAAGVLGGLQFVSVWTSHQEGDPKGRAFLLLPDRPRRAGQLQLRDGDTFWTLQVSSVDGQVKVLADRSR